MSDREKRAPLHEVRKNPNWIPFLSEETLLNIIRIPGKSDDRLRGDIILECIQRLWLNGGGGLENWSQCDKCVEVLRASERPSLDVDGVLDWARRQRENRDYQAPETLDLNLRTRVDKNLGEWMSADGLAVFIAQGANAKNVLRFSSVSVLPFILLKSEEGQRGHWVYCGEERVNLRDLSQGVGQAAEAFKRNVSGNGTAWPLMLHTLHGELNAQLTGNSLGMPAYLAWKVSNRNLRVEPFEMCCSGVVSSAGTLEFATESYIAKARALRQAGVRKILLPPIYNSTYPEDIHVTIVEVQDLARIMDESLEGIGLPPTHGLVELEGRLREWGRQMRYGLKQPDIVLRELEQAWSSLESAQNNAKMRDMRLQWKMHKASALCHLGRPEEAQVLCEEICRDAPSARVAVETFIRAGVNLTHLARYEDALEFFAQANARLSDIDADSSPDFELQLCGSRGQALAFRAVLSGAEEDFQGAVQDLEKALELARDILPADEARDACYICLAHALCRPGEASAIFNKYRDVCIKDKRTRPYFHRVVWLASYRHYLETGCVRLPDPNPDIPEQAKPYVIASAMKYRGALYAATGELKKARQDFERADGEMKGSEGLLGFIHATCLLQAGESLLPEDQQAAHHYLRRAMDRFDEFPGLLHGALAAENWKDRAAGLLEGHTPVVNPQRLYIY